MTNMHFEYWNRLCPLLVESCEGLFKSCGIAVHPVDDTAPAATATADERMVAFVGFTGPQMKGFLIISAPLSLLLEAHPLAGRDELVPEDDVRDWLGEMANQLLGRLKIKLLGYGISFDMSPPACLVATELRGIHGERLSFRSQDSLVFVYLDAVVLPGLRFPEDMNQQSGHAREGDLMFFE